MVNQFIDTHFGKIFCSVCTKIRIILLQCRHISETGVSNHRQFDSLFNTMLRITTKKRFKVRVTGPLCADLWIPRQESTDAKEFQYNDGIVPIVNYDFHAEFLFNRIILLCAVKHRTDFYVFSLDRLFYTHNLTHWGRETHICVGEHASIGLNNGLSPNRRQAII